MNFLTHYIIDRGTDIYHNVGLTFPDVIVLHNNGVGFRRRQVDMLLESDIPDNFRRMCTSMRRHFCLDKWFHASDYFRLLVHKIQEGYTAYTNGDRMAFYYAHILAEILIDRHIINCNPTIHTEFYDDYRRFDFASIAGYFNDIRNFDKVKFLDFCKLFANSTFLYGYNDKADIVRSLHGVTRRMGLEVKFSADESSVADYIDYIFGQIEPDMDQFLRTLAEIPWETDDIRR